MAVKVDVADDGDMARLFEICAMAFARNEPFFDLCYPNHWTVQGRRAGAERFVTVKNADPHTVFLRAVEQKTGRVVGMAKWNIYEDCDISKLQSEKLTGDYWSSEEERTLCQDVIALFLQPRTEAIRQSKGNLVSLDILAIDPDYQRQGIGEQLVRWGTRRADDMRVGAVVESSVFGRGLYERNGFVFDRFVDLNTLLPPGRSSQEVGTFAWLKRPVQTIS